MSTNTPSLLTYSIQLTMAFLFLSLLLLPCFFFSSAEPSNFSQSFPLTTHPLSSFHSSSSSSSLQSSLISPTTKPTNLNAKTPFKYTMALVVSLPIGTPPQTQQMVLDTGSQLSWTKCNDKAPPKPKSTSFDPSLSSSFSVLPCSHPICKPRVPDFTLPTSCDENRLCHYSYFYADGSYAEGNLVREKISLSKTQSTPPLILGCTRASDDAEGILGMNLGRLSFSSQTKISKFSYCVPPRRTNLPGTFYIGENPNSGTFRYVDLMIFSPIQSQRMPNFDKAAYTVGMEGISIGGKRLNIPRTVFRPDAGGAGQTMIDSGSEYTYLVDSAYTKVREEVVRLVVGPRLNKGYVYQNALDLCYFGDVMEIGRLVGDVVLEFEKGAQIVVKKERVFTDIGGGVGCLGFGRSSLLGVESNIIGNFHQQNLWVEFDLVKHRVGFGEADCSKSV